MFLAMIGSLFCCSVLVFVGLGVISFQQSHNIRISQPLHTMSGCFFPARTARARALSSRAPRPSRRPAATRGPSGRRGEPRTGCRRGGSSPQPVAGRGR